MIGIFFVLRLFVLSRELHYGVVGVEYRLPGTFCIIECNSQTILHISAKTASFTYRSIITCNFPFQNNPKDLGPP